MKSIRLCLVLSLAIFVGTASGNAQTASQRPGPAIFYQAPATSPQLENTGIWRAAPILISGASAYRSGEFLYQDYLLDDRGAGGRATYPDDKKYAGNAADFVELRLKPVPGATAIRITYNSMLDPSLVATTLALGNSDAPRDVPFGAQARMPAQIFVTVHDNVAEFTDAATGRSLARKTDVSVDTVRRQVDVRLPISLFDPTGKTVRVAAATGLWNVAGNRYQAPQEAAAGRGGRGAAAAPAATPAPPPRALFFNVAFRYKEPGNVTGTGSFWSDTQQAAALTSGDLSPFFANVDFVKLASGVDDNSAVPTKGFIDRILASHFESAQGRGPAGSLGEECNHTCIPEFPGRLQPYELYVPEKTPPASGYGLTIDIHSAGANYNRWIGLNRHVDFGERGTGSLVVTPNSRGNATWYYGQSAADMFEVWSDVARLYKIDPDYVTLAGVSMGGYGSWKLAAQYPDLFAAAAIDIPCPIAGTGYDGTNAPGGVNSFIYPMVPALRQIPFMMWTAEQDTTCSLHNAKGQMEIFAEYAALGYRYVWFNFLGMPHASSNRFPNWKPFADFLAMQKRVTDVAHVNYVVNTTMTEPEYGLDADHAYWVSGVTVRDAKASVIGTVDVFSHGFGVGDAVPTAKIAGKGVFQSDDPNFPWPNYVTQEVRWTSVPKIRAANVVDIKARNISAVTIDPARAKIDCNAKINLDSDGPVKVTLLGCL